MVFSVLPIKNFTSLILIVLTAFSAAFVGASDVQGKVLVVGKSANLGVIKGIVRDEAGNTIADATVAIFRVGTSKLLKQVRSAADGSFLAKIMPGTYTVLAVAEGFNAVTLATVEVNRSAELVYGFKLERTGNGNTLPEKRVDRNSSKWRIRSAQSRRSVYQNTEGDAPIDENTVAENDADSIEVSTETDDEEISKRRMQSVIETYFAGSGNESFTGLNFATLQPLNENAEIIIAGQGGTNQFAPQRLETTFRFRPNEKHQVSLKGSVAKLGKIEIGGAEQTLGQFSFQALDEWKVKGGIILVFGFDYSKFIGAGKDFSVSPRFGLQFDVNSKTRFRTAYTTATEERTWSSVADLEEAQVLFREPVSMQEFVVENEKPRMNKNSRLEFGIERVLDNKSSIEANVFFDAVSGRGIGLTNLPFESSSGQNLADFVVNQQGGAQGIRIVYSRRLSSRFSTSAGYAFGSGQKLSPEAISNPANILENDFFQTLYGQFDADFKTGTQVKTIFRLSPQATVFAIDPFAGRMAIYDPSLSVMVTQLLPNLGLPFRAQAVLDARNLFDYQIGAVGEEGSLRLNSQRRILRGGILVRF
ncbi:MAG: carboxypeptidase regulatory-like domain-containing protein [Pyrinomonadaceae bacterium]|nr:carboxypeptidase regulatory-like domain-containing protein [Pyrinomonadaceae bacterium]